MTTFRSCTFEVKAEGTGNRAAQTAAWLLEQGARVIVRDDGLRERLVTLLRKHASDGDAYDDLMLRLAKSGRGEPADENALFAAAWKKRIIGITGRNGKTTAATWAAHLIGDAVVVGHLPERSPLASLSSRARIAVLELHGAAPAMKRFSSLSTDEPHPAESLPVGFSDQWGAGNARNAAVAFHAARLAGVPVRTIVRRMKKLPVIPRCQEIVRRDRTVTVVDDTAATSPEAGEAAVQRFGGANCILVTGGDGAGDYRAWADAVAARVNPNNTFFVAGSATRAMKAALGERAFGIRTFDTAGEAWRAAKRRAALFLSAVILYSPAAESVDTDVRSW